MKMIKISEYSIKEPSFQQQQKLIIWICRFSGEYYCILRVLITVSQTPKKNEFSIKLSDHCGASVGPTGATARPPGRNKRTNQSCAKGPQKIPKGLRFDYPALRSSWDFLLSQSKNDGKMMVSCAIWHTYLMWNQSVERSPPANGWLSDSHLHLLQSSAAMYQVEGLHTLKYVPMIWLFGDFVRSTFDIWCYFPGPSNAAQKAEYLRCFNNVFILLHTYMQIMLYLHSHIHNEISAQTEPVQHKWPNNHFCLLSSKLKGLGCHAAIFTA